jgi:hypothetical protein
MQAQSGLKIIEEAPVPLERDGFYDPCFVISQEHCKTWWA